MIKKHNKIKFMTISTLSLILSISFVITSCKNTHEQIPQNSTSISLSTILDLYGYTTIEQKKALTYVLQQANILIPPQTLDDHYPAKASKENVVNNLVDFIEQTQQHFTIRKASQERWDVQPEVWMETTDQEKLLQKLKQLNVVDTITPTLNHYDAICILGSTLKSMQTRARYVANLINKDHMQTETIIMLVGERYVTLNVDGDAATLKKIAQHNNLEIKKLTETQLGIEAYQTSAIPKNIPLHVIDTPKGNLSRPTTETTLQELIKFLKNKPTVKSILFISNQPNVYYQQAIIAEVLKHYDAHVLFEVIGPMATQPTIQSLVGALGSYLWAKTPDIFDILNITITDQELQSRLKKLYEKNPIISKHINKLCGKK